MITSRTRLLSPDRAVPEWYGTVPTWRYPTATDIRDAVDDIALLLRDGLEPRSPPIDQDKVKATAEGLVRQLNRALGLGRHPGLFLPVDLDRLTPSQIATLCRWLTEGE